MAGEINDVFDTNSGTTNQTNFKEGTIVTVDADGNKVELYPNVKTDSTLSMVNKPADAAAVGDKLAAMPKIQFVLKLPEDAADHEDTYYFIPE